MLWNCNDFIAVPVPDPDPDIFMLFNKSCLFNVRSSIISQKAGLSFLIFFYFIIPFYVESRSKSSSGSGTRPKTGSDNETVVYSGSGSAKVPS